MLSFGCNRGDLDLVNALLPHAERSTFVPHSVLECACAGGCADIVHTLLHGLKWPSSTLKEALMRAIQAGHHLIVKMLLQSRVEVDFTFSNRTHMYVAVIGDHVSIVRLLLYKLASSSRQVQRRYDVSGALDSACKNNQVDMVEILLNFGVKETRKRRECPILHECARKGQADIVETLMKFGFDPNVEDRGCSALYSACMKGHTNVVKVLLGFGQHQSIISLPWKKVQLRTDWYQNLQVKTEQKLTRNGYTPLSVACQMGLVDIVRLLIAAGAMDSPQSSGMCAVTEACFHGQFRVLKVLMKHNYPILGTSAGLSPLMIACEKGHEEIVLFLLDSGAKQTVDKRGETPIYHACRGGWINIIKILVDYGGDVNQPTNNGNTPLHLASSQGYWKVITCLLELGAHVTFNEMKDTPLDIARTERCLKLILQAQPPGIQEWRQRKQS